MLTIPFLCTIYWKYTGTKQLQPLYNTEQNNPNLFARYTGELYNTPVHYCRRNLHVQNSCHVYTETIVWLSTLLPLSSHDILEKYWKNTGTKHIIPCKIILPLTVLARCNDVMKSTFRKLSNYIYHHQCVVQRSTVQIQSSVCRSRIGFIIK